MQELKLTAEQSAELEQIIQASRARMTADKEDLDRAQSDFRQLMERPAANQRELLKAAERLEMARYSIAKERTMMGVRIHSVLTPEQRKGLDAIAKRHQAEQDRKNQKQTSQIVPGPLFTSGVRDVGKKACCGSVVRGVRIGRRLRADGGV